MMSPVTHMVVCLDVGTIKSFTLHYNLTKNTSSAVGSTGFLICEPFTQLPLSVPVFSSFESSFVILKIPHSKLTVFNVCHPPSSSTFAKPFCVLLDELRSFFSVAATTPHEFLITNNFSIHLSNASDHTPFLL